MRLAGIPDVPRLVADMGNICFIKGIPHDKTVAPAFQVDKPARIGFGEGTAGKIGDVYIQRQTGLMFAGPWLGNEALDAFGILLFFFGAERAFDQQLFFCISAGYLQKGVCRQELRRNS